MANQDLSTAAMMYVADTIRLLTKTHWLPVLLLGVFLISGTGDAQAGGLSRKEVRAIVREEIAKLPRIRGPRGPEGPAGPSGPSGPQGEPGLDTLQPLHAYVNAFGIVDPERSFGITSENIIRVHNDGGGDPEATSTHYCFVGVTGVREGQVTLDLNGNEVLDRTAYLRINWPHDYHPTGRPEDITSCTQVVAIVDRNGRGVDANFYILLY